MFTGRNHCHLGGTFEEIVASERTFSSDMPFVLLGQPSLFDAAGLLTGRHTAWAYCHVPNGSTKDVTNLIERQITRFAPEFRDCILSKSVSSPASLERWNPNLVGGNISGGAMNIGQLLFRPTALLHRTPKRGLYLCGASSHQAVVSTECVDITLPVQLSEIFGISRIKKLTCSLGSTESAEVLSRKGISCCHITRCVSVRF